MWLLDTERAHVIEVYGANLPPYAILSHTWSTGEILIQDILRSDIDNTPWATLSKRAPQAFGGEKKKGLDKIIRSANLARWKNYQHIWIDTCCIDKTSSAELSEAINSMYRWYAEADICYAYLADVPAAGVEDVFHQRSKFRQSRWFTRGWTLQELIASRQVEFFAADWSYLGAKTGDIAFTRLLNEITGVHLDVLTGETSPHDVSIAARMHWAAERQTTRVEDIAYCLLGIFNVNMPLLYGEGKRSFIRLQEVILANEEDQSLFAWHSEPSITNATGNVGQSTGFTGLLADSPDRFSDHNDIEIAIPLALTGNPSAITSKGLGVDFLLLPCPEDQATSEADFRVILNCERVRDGQRESPVIYLKRIWGMGDQFARMLSDFKTFIPPHNTLLDGGEYERVFIKQDPTADMRTIRVTAAKDNSQLQLRSRIGQRITSFDWKIKDAWPSQGWTRASQVFQTESLTFGLPCAIVRLEIQENGHPTSVDVAIGMHASNERSCRSWCQIMTLESFLDPESTFSWAMREAKSGTIRYDSLSTQDIHGTNASTWIVVTEQNRKKRLDITVHVLSDNTASEEAPKPSVAVDPVSHRRQEDYGHIIPLSTLSKVEQQRVPDSRYADHLMKTQADLVWDARSVEIKVLMGDNCVLDSIETSVFPRISFGSKVRTKPESINASYFGFIADHHLSDKANVPSSDTLLKYCVDALPVSDNETRRLVQVLCGTGDVDPRSCLDASRILQGKDDTFLQLHPMHWAVLGGNVQVVKILDEAGVDLYAESDRRLTTLHLAFLLKKPDIINHIWSRLYEAKSNQDDFKDKRRWDILNEMCNECMASTASNFDSPLHFAAAYATNREFWTSCIDEMHDSPQINRHGERPIHRAAAMGNLEAVSYFLRSRSSDSEYYQNTPDDQGRTPLWHAACTDHSGAITAKLLEYHADPSLPGDNGLAPIHVACRHGTLGCLRELRARGVGLNLRAGVNNLLPTHFAATYGHIGCLKLLLKYKAPIISYVRDGSSISALHLAIANGQEACARAIWNSASSNKSELKGRGWQLCVVAEPLALELKWMYFEVTGQHWFAVEDPTKGGATRDFVCFSKEESSPKLWGSPTLTRPTVEDENENENSDAVSHVDDRDHNPIHEAGNVGSQDYKQEQLVEVPFPGNELVSERSEHTPDLAEETSTRR